MRRMNAICVRPGGDATVHALGAKSNLSSMQAARRSIGIFGFIAACASMLSSANASGADCDISITAAPPSVRIHYNPFDAAPASHIMQFQLKNSGAAECDAALALFRSGPMGATGNGGQVIGYTVSDTRGESVIGEGVLPPARLAPGFTGRAMRMSAQSLATVDLIVSAPRGQMISPADYSDALDIGLYRLEGGVQQKIRDGGRLALTITSRPVMTLSLAGGGRKTTLNFGDLREGATRSLMLQAYTNQGFRLSVSSENGGLLRPVDDTARAEGGWRVPYTISVNRAGHMALASETRIDVSAVSTPILGLQIPVEVRIGQVAGQRAGLYRDVITIKIDPAG